MQAHAFSIIICSIITNTHNHTHSLQLKAQVEEMDWLDNRNKVFLHSLHEMGLDETQPKGNFVPGRDEGREIREHSRSV